MTCPVVPVHNAENGRSDVQCSWQSRKRRTMARSREAIRQWLILRPLAASAPTGVSATAWNSCSTPAFIAARCGCDITPWLRRAGSCSLPSRLAEEILDELDAARAQHAPRVDLEIPRVAWDLASQRILPFATVRSAW
jgi:hypothetical protein